MNCLSPINITFKRPLVNRATGEVKYSGYVPCGRCEACAEMRRLQWFVRLREEQKHCSSSYFITLTYSDCYLPVSDKYDKCFDKRQVQLFLKRLRSKLHPSTFRYFLISEYGTNTHRPHYHLHYFGTYVDKMLLYEAVSNAWPFGLIHIGECNDSSLNYVCGHVQYSIAVPDNYEPPFTLMSRRPGLGFYSVPSLSLSSQESDILQLYSDGQGKRFSLPRYYRERIYKKESRDARAIYLEENTKPPTQQEIYEFKRRIDKRRKSRIKI